MRRTTWSRVAVVAMLAAAPTASEAGGPYVFYSVTPCRLADTRNPAGPTSGQPLMNGVTQPFTVWGTCGIPSTAKAVAINGAVTQAGGAGWLLLFPYNTPLPPDVSTINFAQGEQGLANGQLVALTNTPGFQLSVYPSVAGTGTVHLILDITGYFQEP